MVALCLLITFGSCSDDDAPAEITPNPDSEIYFTGSLDFTSDSGEAILSFTTNKDWSIDVSQSGGDVSWCTVFPNKGKAGESQVSVRVARNEGVDDRNVVLNLTAGDLTKSIVVTQKQKDAITLTTAKFEVDKNGGEIQVEVKANVSYEVVIPEQYQSWIREGSGSGQIIMGDKGHNQMHEPATRTDMDRTVRKFYISKSEEYDKREGEIIFRSGELEEVLKVYQTGGGILLLTKNEYTVSDKGEQIVVELNSNFDFDVKMPQVDWITTTATRSVSSHTLYYTIAPNGTYGKREAEIIYYDRNDKSVADTLKIIQVQKDAIMLSQKEYSVGMEGGTIRIEIKANVAYETFIPEQYRGWIHKGTSTRGLSTSNLSFIIDKNNEYNKREGEIIFQNGKQKEVLKVCQAERAFLNLIKNEYTISDEGGRIAVELNSNFDFDVRMPQVDWITVTTTRSVSTHTLYYMIAPNEAYNKREAKIIYYNRNNEGLADTLNVVQQGKSVLELTLETAGSLKRKMEILNIDYLKVKKIVLEGDINGSDIRLIREMAGVNYIEKETNGVLEYLDLTNVNIVEGGEIYCYPDSYKPGTLDKYEDCYTKNNVIGNCMFRKCKSLKKVLLPYSCVKIENESFAYCKNLIEVKLFDNVATIGGFCFYSCSLLQKINLPNSIKMIGDSTFSNGSTFSGCSSLESIDFPDKITCIHANSFSYCSSLKEIVIPKSVTYIEGYAFAYCSNLKSIIVSDSVTGFPETTFYDCTSLEKIIFGTGLKTGGVFWDSKYIKEIHCRSTIPPSIIGFNNEVYNNATLYVPKGCNEAYHTAIMWREFKTIVEE